MRFSIIVSEVIAFLSVAVFAAPNEITPRENPVAIPAKLIPESIVNATALGVDVWGPVPDDATKGNGFYTATPGTLGWAWIRAQQDLGSYEDLLESRGLLPSAAVEKRQTTSITVNAYSGDWCTGSAWHFTNPAYNVRVLPSENSFWYSFGFSYRTLRANENVQLRRGPYNGDRCQTWHGTINGPTQAGICWQIASTTCFEMKQT
ncbi:uncharacterized protein PODANS_1_16110 [Podospora anserina S mat+]|uniref:Podospora anserina S mat+ genomic DNA chromosome 1, supercontig 4 n=1 Tax=Podospora anserina (strain S / ATCC MYA-4624 / DSM 980 / FGSC 10383) TaxID=515849 RepID=B2ATJ9_PODAN|nr:uncharacterized protein PODANS_1_16110 [Podospora anserina S mat+]CAP67722.1 unnamed protein product [Podospora anserina S mat+]CDP23980.1 Putative protein of unknown function [Podospora anserina S mat+]